MKKSLAICTAAYNEEKVLPDFLKTTSRLLSIINKEEKLLEYEIWVADDGSKDKTWEIINSFHSKDPRIKGIKLKKNYGQHLAGFKLLEYINADLIVMLDCDINFNFSILPELIQIIEKDYTVWIVSPHRDFTSKILSEAIVHLIKFRYHNIFLPSNVLAFGFPKEIANKINRCRNKTFLNLCVGKVSSFNQVITTHRLPSKRPSRYTLKKRLLLGMEILQDITGIHKNINVEITEVLI